MYFHSTSSLCLYSLIEKWGLASAEKRKLPCSLRDHVHSSPCPQCIFLSRSPFSELITSPISSPLRAPANVSHYPCSLTLDLSCSPYLTPAVDPGKLPSQGALEEGGRTEICLIWLPFSLRHTAAAVRGHHWAHGFTLPERIISLWKLHQNQGPKCFCFLYQFVRTAQCNIWLWHWIPDHWSIERGWGDQGFEK